MNRFIYVLFLCLPFFTWAQDYNSLVKKGDSLYNLKQFEESRVAYQAAFKIKQGSAQDLYNAACSAALAGKSKIAFDLLQQAMDAGWTNIYHLRQDTDLNTLHTHKQWVVLQGQMQKKIDVVEAGYDKALQKSLLQIFDDDQQPRHMIDSVEKKFGRESAEMKAHWRYIILQDSINLEKVKQILDMHGWVPVNKVGGRAAQALFLVVQHADIATQQKCLPLMRKAVSEGNASASSLALLEDRVALRMGDKQIYGSQIGRDPSTGESFVFPLIDPDNVDVRRNSVGLGPLNEYVSKWGIQWNVDDYKSREYPNYMKEE